VQANKDCITTRDRLLKKLFNLILDELEIHGKFPCSLFISLENFFTKILSASEVFFSDVMRLTDMEKYTNCIYKTAGY
jgi:hypothetical protein